MKILKKNIYTLGILFFFLVYKNIIQFNIFGDSMIFLLLLPLLDPKVYPIKEFNMAKKTKLKWAERIAKNLMK